MRYIIGLQPSCLRSKVSLDIMSLNDVQYLAMFDSSTVFLKARTHSPEIAKIWLDSIT